jgi:cell division protein FtsZ
MESSREIAAALRGADMVFITAGMGGGTGTGAAPVAAEIARELGAVVVSVVTMPFGFEMTRRSQNARQGVRALQPHSHTLITVPNDRLIELAPRGITLEVAFRVADDVLRQGVQAIAELITQPGLINVDFAHIRHLMLRGGGSLMAIGLGEGDDKARLAIHQALHHPLLDVDHFGQANGILVHFTGGDDLTLFEVGEAVDELREQLPPDVDLIFGATTEATMTGRAQVILIVTGIGGSPAPVEEPALHAVAAPVTVPQPAMTAAPADPNDLDVPAFLRRRLSLAS